MWGPFPFSISNKRRNEWIKLIAGLNAVLINRSECRGCGSNSNVPVKGGRGKNSRERASYLALFSFSTREMKIKESAFRDLRAPRRSDLSAARPVASHRTRHYCVRAHPKCTFINRSRVSLVSWEGDTLPLEGAKGASWRWVEQTGQSYLSAWTSPRDFGTRSRHFRAKKKRGKKGELFLHHYCVARTLSANCHWERISFQYRRRGVTREKERERILASLDRILEFEIRFCYFTLRGASNLFSLGRSIHFNV